MSYHQFLKNLEANKIYETIALERICDLNNVSLLNTCDTSAYDFKTSDNITYEVKCDHMVLNTGNFYIEFCGYGKPSGISISQAQYHILTDKKYYFLISTDKLRALTENCIRKKTSDGLTSGYLLKRGFIVKNSVCI